MRDVEQKWTVKMHEIWAHDLEQMPQPPQIFWKHVLHTAHQHILLVLVAMDPVEDPVSRKWVDPDLLLVEYFRGTLAHQICV